MCLRADPKRCSLENLNRFPNLIIRDGDANEEEEEDEEELEAVARCQTQTRRPQPTIPQALTKKSLGNLPEKSMSFHGRGTLPLSDPGELRRLKTLPELLSSGQSIGPVASTPRLTKLLLNVTVQGSLGAVQIVISPEAAVSDLIDAAVRQYVKECRRPFLPESEPSRFDLHYSQFSLEMKVFDTHSCTWSMLKTYGKPPVSRGGQSVTIVGKTLVIFGGQDAKRSLLNDLHIFEVLREIQVCEFESDSQETC